ncbi:transcriptional regulator (plasmid) [Psychrobacter sp. Choline-02u-13]|uniref:winged helix-turn-helix transcriptional regulator n=1 Tax=unclassified Psychrobacter TaxID=196806 RepID=UPI000869AB91|nr:MULTISPECIES: helix-turn-helix domain-containing protein [unclassified Psychrobacter]OEH66882.1 MAG: HxlR family transcriptional regulator [Psychrobacter sp. B29-1]PKG63019.1 transcriptional regulator [Psychrobacter sp. Choline-02u-13]PKH57330.1 transcriptional regulator [Psychrobacter sp. Choline-02u-9]
MRWDELDKQPCSVARTLAVIGDRWTLMILRDCFLDVRRFDIFEQRLGITRHVLSDRLRKLVEYDVLKKVAYQQQPLREEYRLTERGLDLHPIVLALVSWGDKHMADERGAPLLHRHKECGQIMHPVTVCPECHEPINARDIEVEIGPDWIGGDEFGV